jgi:hypothetical protein
VFWPIRALTAREMSEEEFNRITDDGFIRRKGRIPVVYVRSRELLGGIARLHPEKENRRTKAVRPQGESVRINAN